MRISQLSGIFSIVSGFYVWMINKTLHTLKKYLWLIPLAFITIHAFLMNGYYYCHPQLTTGSYLSQIFAYGDPSLFKNSIYVQAVNRTNLRISLFYNACPFILRNFDFETFALVQSIISLFFVLAGIFYLTRVLFGNSTAGYTATLLYTAELNNWTLGSPAPYLNFFHHGLPYAYPLTIWSMAFFFQKRLLLSSLLAGIAWDFHPMSTVFLLFIYGVYWLFNRKEFKPLTTVMGIALFIVTSLPAFLKSFQHVSGGSGSGPLWLKGVLWVAGYTCFPSSWSFDSYMQAGMFFLLFLSTLFIIPRNQLKTIGLVTVSVGFLCIAGTIFADIYPIPFIIKLSLWRSTVIYLVVAISCIGYGVSTLLTNQSFTKQFLAVCIVVLLTGYLGSLRHFHISYLPLFIGALLFSHFEDQVGNSLSFLRKNFSSFFFILLSLLLAVHIVTNPKDGLKLLLFFVFIAFFLLGIRAVEKYAPKKALSTYVWGLIIVFVLIFDTTILYSRGGPKIYYHGRFQGQSDPWAEIQRFAKMHSEKDDLFIVPPGINDFTTYSLRAILGDWSEGTTLLYLGNRFTQEWFARMNDLGSTAPDFNRGYNSLTTNAVLRVARKYKAKFIVTEKSKTFKLKKIYENSAFILYEATPRELQQRGISSQGSP